MGATLKIDRKTTSLEWSSTWEPWLSIVTVSDHQLAHTNIHITSKMELVSTAIMLGVVYCHMSGVVGYCHMIGFVVSCHTLGTVVYCNVRICRLLPYVRRWCLLSYVRSCCLLPYVIEYACSRQITEAIQRRAVI